MSRSFSDISIIGGGSFGTAIASHVARARGSSILYARDEDIVSEINQYHTNSKYFGNITLPPSLKATNDFEEILLKSAIITIAVPSHSFTETLEELRSSKIEKDVVILVATKGIADDPVELFSTRIKKILPNPFCFFSGPNFAKEIVENKFTAITISSEDLQLAKEVALALNSENCETSVSDDIITIQIASVVKNIIAIKSGMMNAAGAGENAKAWLMTKAMQEIAIIAKALGSIASALLEPAVIGDLVLTSYSSTSRNTKFGYEFHNSGYEKNFAKKYPVLVEGIEGARLMKKLLSNYELELPVIGSVIKMLDLEA